MSLSGSYSPSAFFQALAVAPPGPTTVRGSFTVTGDLSINRPGLRIDGATVQGTVEFESGASGSAFANGNAEGFDVRGADNITIEGSTFDGACRRAQNWVIEEPAGRVPSGTTIRGNTFRNYYICADSDVHTEALFIAYSNGGLIEGNTFEDNGTTAHVFFSYVGANARWTRATTRKLVCSLQPVRSFEEPVVLDSIPARDSGLGQHERRPGLQHLRSCAGRADHRRGRRAYAAVLSREPWRPPRPTERAGELSVPRRYGEGGI